MFYHIFILPAQLIRNFFRNLFESYIQKQMNAPPTPTYFISHQFPEEIVCFPSFNAYSRNEILNFHSNLPDEEGQYEALYVNTTTKTDDAVDYDDQPDNNDPDQYPHHLAG